MLASHYYFSTINQINITADEAALINSDDYIAMRKEINRWFPSSDWAKVKRLGENLGREVGLNVITAVYYAVACVKLDGVIGLAYGLEIVFAALAAERHSNELFGEKHAQQMRWLFRAIKDDVCSLQPSQQNLRDLYRCERVCIALRGMIGADHPAYPPGLEVLENTLFEFIDQLSPRYIAASDAMEPLAATNSSAADASPKSNDSDNRKSSPWWLMIILLVGLSVILALGMAVVYCQSINDKLGDLTDICLASPQPLAPDKEATDSQLPDNDRQITDETTQD